MKGYGLHQDRIAWDGFPRTFLTVLVPFDAADRDNGCTVVCPGYHSTGPLSPEDGQYHELPPGTVDEARAVPRLLEPGDVAVFGGFTPTAPIPTSVRAGGASCTSVTMPFLMAATSGTRTTASSTRG